MYAIISFHDEGYQPLADITWFQNKKEYCERHGYAAVHEILTVHGHGGQMHKVDFINRMLHDPANYEWVWWTGCDLMITNMTTKMEDKVDDNYQMILATDCNGFNSDSILIKNSPESKEYWGMIRDVTATLHWHWEGEQKAIKDSYPNYKKQIKVVPQRDINSYDYNIYGDRYKPYDFLGTNGQWQHGDWVIQWPGIFLPERVKLAEYYSTLIVR